VRRLLSRRAVLLLAILPLAAPGVAEAKRKNWSLGDRVPLREGMHGHDVRVLQDFLTKAGQETDVDGSFGADTEKSVEAFEEAASLPVDGVVSAQDVAALRSAAAAPASLRAAPAVPEATIGPDGLAVAPAGAPPEVAQIIAAGNAIAGKPYKYGGGHGKWNDSGYDCSGSVSYALHGAGLLDEAMPSGSFEDWGDPGPGTWVTIYANGGHMYMTVAGLRFDTSARRQVGGRWTTESRASGGYVVRHPPGL
jgi:peptidoglycan hydrolase-like protein with peptidoglycan-binding domain